MAVSSLPVSLRLAPSRRRRPVSVAVWTWLKTAGQARRTRRQLAEMDDRMLSDIGLSRSHAQTEAARPAWDCAPHGW